MRDLFRRSEYPITEVQNWAHTRLGQLLAREVGLGGNDELLPHLGQRLGRIERSGIFLRRCLGGEDGLGGLYSHDGDGCSEGCDGGQQIRTHYRTELRKANQVSGTIYMHFITFCQIGELGDGRPPGCCFRFRLHDPAPVIRPSVAGVSASSRAHARFLLLNETLK